MVYPMGGLEYSCFKILWSMRIFPKEIVFFILESSESPVFFNEDSEINFLDFRREFFSDYTVPIKVIGASWWNENEDLTYPKGNIIYKRINLSILNKSSNLEGERKGLFVCPFVDSSYSWYNKKPFKELPLGTKPIVTYFSTNTETSHLRKTETCSSSDDFLT